MPFIFNKSLKPKEQDNQEQDQEQQNQEQQKQDQNQEQKGQEKKPQFNQIHNTTQGIDEKYKELLKYQYTPDEIRLYNPELAIQNHPLLKKPFPIRSKMAYAGIMQQIRPTNRYLLPGQLAVFGYANPKYKTELEYYDMTPLVLFLGIFRTKTGNIRELGLNLHYFPLFARTRMLYLCYDRFKPYWQHNFNFTFGRANQIMSYEAVKHIMKSNYHLNFGIKEYIPSLRGKTYLLPARLFSTAAMTEGRFSKATINQVMTYWRRFFK